MGRSKADLEYRQIPAGSGEARRLFAYRAAWAPPAGPGEFGWGAWVKDEGSADAPERMVGVLLVERRGATGIIHGPVVAEANDPLEVAARLLAATLSHATTVGVETLFARPQGLDRVWVRFGFIPVPEADLPAAFKGRPGTGLFAWRGGSALWSSRKRHPLEADALR